MRPDVCARHKVWPYVALTAAGVVLTAYIQVLWDEIARAKYSGTK